MMKNTAAKQFAVGDNVYARRQFGKVLVIVTLGEKDGREVFDLSDGTWAYRDQLERAR